MRLPKITVCILTYNRSHYLIKTIKSIEAQKYDNKEILVLDDKSPDDTKVTVSQLKHTYKNIKYIRNDTNLGLRGNFKKSLEISKTDIIMYLGDDDILIDDNALSMYAKAFRDKKTLLARSKQILFTQKGIKQISEINTDDEMSKFEAGESSYTNYVFESISIAGLAFRFTRALHEMVINSETMYPQYDLVAKICLRGNSVQINKYLIGIRSHEGQLNVLNYKLKKYETNIVDDMTAIYKDIVEYAKKIKSKYIPSKDESIFRIYSFIPILFPSNSLHSGRKSSYVIVKRLIREIGFSHLFKIIFYFLVSLLPRFILNPLISTTNDRNLKSNRNRETFRIYSGIISRYS